MYMKSILRHLQSTNVDAYLTPVDARLQLNYPASCLDSSSTGFDMSSMVGIGFRSQGSGCYYQIEVTVCSSSYQILYKRTVPESKRQKPSQSAGSQIQRILQNKILVGYDLGEILKMLQITHNNFIDLVHLCPHGIGPSHRNSINNIVKQVLKITIDIDNRRERPPINHDYRRNHYRYGGEREQQLEAESSDHDSYRERGRQPSYDSKPYLLREATICLKVVEKYISNGSGVVTSLPTEKKHFADIDELLQEAEIDKKKVCGLYLRGSRALGLEISSEEYQSDWDYICILDTWATVNTILLKLYDVDLIVLDRKSAEILINSNDLPMVELFALPSSCIFINEFKPPPVSHSNLKKSLVYHLRKANLKLMYYGAQFYNHMHGPAQYSVQSLPNSNKLRQDSFQDPRRRQYRGIQQRGPRGRDGRYRRYRNQQGNEEFKHELLDFQGCEPSSRKAAENVDPSYVKWKVMKILHLQIRFLDLYLQFVESNVIKDVKRATPFWNQLSDICRTKGFPEGYKMCRLQINRLLNIAFTSHELQFLKLKFSYLSRTSKNNRSHQDYGRRGRRRRDNSPKIPDVALNTLSVYINSITLSDNARAELKGANRNFDLQDDTKEFSVKYWQKNQHYTQEQATKIDVNQSIHPLQKRNSLQLYKVINANLDVGEKYFKYVLAPYFVEPRHFYELTYVQRQKQDKDKERDYFCLSNFMLKENANQQLQLVQEAKSAIFKCHTSELTGITNVKTLVCLKYKNLHHFSSEQRNDNIMEFNNNQYDIFEKRDGALAALYYVNGWIVSSKQSPDGRQPISSDSQATFSQQFLSIFKKLQYQMPEEKDNHRVFLFELLSTNVRNIIDKDKDELILHGVRNMKSLEEQQPQAFAEKYGWNFAERVDVGSYDFSQLESIAQNRINCAGFILRDANFNRIVINNSSYLKRKWQLKLETLINKPKLSFFHRCIEENRKNYFIYTQVILKNKEREYSKLFPEDAEIVNTIANYVKQVNEQCERLRETTKDLHWRSPQISVYIAQKRVDLLIYLFGFCNRTYPQMFKNRSHASVDFFKTFSFILQELHHRQPPSNQEQK